jgi:hypothetical protein
MVRDRPRRTHMKRTLVALAFAAALAVPGAAQATEPEGSITAGTPACYATVDYDVQAPVVVDLTRPPFVYFVLCPGGCLSAPGAAVHCPV